ncbi:MAG TPA: O-antigen ligase family protein [Candidatus Acidoferrales bacterium]|nr:O-antigen ligase family protein [Candidatus Acidoferrales bacterium]
MAAETALLCFGILTIWVPERWALAAYQAGVFGVGLFWAAGMAVRPFPLRWSYALIVLTGPAVCGLVQLATGHTAYPGETWNSVLNWSVNWVLFCLALQFAGDAGLGRRFLNAVMYLGFALSVISTVQMFTSEGKIFWIFPSGYEDFVLGPFVNRNLYSAFIEMVLPLALLRAIQNPQRAFLYWLMASVMVASVVAGASRAGLALVITEIAVIVALAWWRGFDRRTIARGMAQFAVLAVVLVVVVGWDVVWQRFRAADPFAIRRELVASSIQMARDRPWTGFGLGTWPTVYPAYALYDNGLFVNQAHNDWLQWAVEGGLPLLATILVFAVLIARSAWRSIWGLGLIAFLVHALVDFPMQKPQLAGFWFALCGVLTGLAPARDHIRPTSTTGAAVRG